MKLNGNKRSKSFATSIHDVMCYGSRDHHQKSYTFNMPRAVCSSGFHRNVIILLKVNPGVAAGEQLTGGRERENNGLIIVADGKTEHTVPLTHCSRRSLGGSGFDQSSSSLDSSTQRLFPPVPPPKPPRSYLTKTALFSQHCIIMNELDVYDSNLKHDV